MGTNGKQLPLPPLVISVTRMEMAGRDEALARLQAAFDDAADGQKRLVLISGDPGIGKTRLALGFAAEAHASGANVLFGRCDEEPLTPYQPFVEALRYYVAGTAVDSLRDQLGRGGADVARIVPELRELLPDLGESVRGEGEDERYWLFEAVVGLLETLSSDDPLVLVLDDIHWADKPTLLLLTHLIRHQTPCRLLVLGTYRGTELARTHPLGDVLAELQREEAHERLPLAGMDEPVIRALLESVAPSEDAAAVSALAVGLRDQTAGNPFFLHQMIDHYKETGVLRESDGLWTADLQAAAGPGVPQGVREVVGRRLSRLSDSANAILPRAAILGQEFAVELLERIGGIDPEALSDALDEAVTAGLVEVASREQGTYRFSHPLFRETLYSELNALRRTRAHRQVAETLEELSATHPGERLASWPTTSPKPPPAAQTERRSSTRGGPVSMRWKQPPTSRRPRTSSGR